MCLETCSQTFSTFLTHWWANHSLHQECQFVPIATVVGIDGQARGETRGTTQLENKAFLRKVGGSRMVQGVGNVLWGWGCVGSENTQATASDTDNDKTPISRDAMWRTRTKPPPTLCRKSSEDAQRITGHVTLRHVM